MNAAYRWKITKDHLTETTDDCGTILSRSDVGVEGPKNLDSSIASNRSHFVMKDDDDNTYYEGELYGDYSGFEPLEDFGLPNAGCTKIFYNGKQL